MRSLLIIDTCGDQGSVALFTGDRLMEEVVLPERTASAALLGAVRQVLAGAGLHIENLDGIGVVNGPGSFTGLRVGLSVTKGLCESAGLRVAAVSRLALLADAGSEMGALAVLRAGRDEVYVRQAMSGESPTEHLVKMDAFRAMAGARPVVYAEAALAPSLPASSTARHIELSAQCAFALVTEALQAGGDSLEMLDANYVRDEQAIYSRQRPQA